MRILIVGGNGTIGKAVANALSEHELIIAGKTQGDIQVDMTSGQSIDKMYKALGKLDAVIMTTGKAQFGALETLDKEAHLVGINNKLLGQLELVHKGLKYMHDGGSFTLTTGVLNQQAIRYAASAAMINGAIDAFVQASAIEMPRGIRINVVSPTVILESMPTYANYFKGFKPIAAADAALGYVKSVEGLQTGQIYKLGY